MGKEKLVPELRFPEYEGEWEVKSLSELLSFKNGINASKEDYGSGYKFINVLDIINNEYITYDKILGAVNVSESEFQKNIVEYGDILFQRSSETREEVGQSNVYLDKEKPATFGGFVIRGKRIGQYDPLFLNKLLSTPNARKSITDKSGGSTRYNVGQDTLSTVKIYLAPIAEQTRIATFLTTVDKCIALLSQKKENLESYKKGVMQKIFNQEIRFKDEKGNEFPEWEEKKLEELVSIVKGQQLNASELTESGDYPCLNGGVAPSGYTDKFNTEMNTITISEGGNSCGYVNFMKTRFWCGGHCYSLLKLKSFIDREYLFNYLKFIEPQIMSLRVGSGLPNIQKKDISIISIKLPVIDEQQKISSFLSRLNKQVDLIDIQISTMKSWKKGLLQKMFV